MYKCQVIYTICEGCRKLKPQEIIEFIKNERIRKGLSQSRLAKESGLSRELIGKFELGKHSPKLSTVEKIGKALDLEIVIRKSGEEDERHRSI